MESRLAALTLDTDDLSKLSELSSRTDLPSTFQPGNISQVVTTLPAMFNMLITRRAIIPAANGHCSARALARYYATLVDGGVVPPPHSSFSKPPLGSHHHIPKLSSQKTQKKQKDSKNKELVSASKFKNKDYGQNQNHGKDVEIGSCRRNLSTDSLSRLVDDSSTSNGRNDSNISVNVLSNYGGKIFRNSRIHDAFLGVGEYWNLVQPDGKFGLGFRRYISKEGSLIGFGHSGMGGSTGFCDVENRFAISVTLNKMSLGAVTANIIHLVCSELNIPVPEEYSRFKEMGLDGQLNLGRPLIN